jgi:hypothetical protein
MRFFFSFIDRPEQNCDSGRQGLFGFMVKNIMSKVCLFLCGYLHLNGLYGGFLTY